MSTKDRFQNPSVGDTINLRFLTYNNNNPTDVYDIDKVQIWFLDPNEKTADNPDGRRLVTTIETEDIDHEDTGRYITSLLLETEKYVIGTYFDIWHIRFRENEEDIQEIIQYFEVYPDRWYTTPIPTVYDFDFHFQPNKLRKGSKQFLAIEIRPNVPNAKDLQRYYENLAVSADLKITVEQRCGDCVPEEQDLRKVIDEVAVEFREKRYGYYPLDTADMDVGVYDVYFKLEFGGNIYVSDRQQLLIYD